MADEPNYTLAQIANILGVACLGDDEREIQQILTDSRRLIFPNQSLFFALKTESNDGHKYIKELYKLGVKAFVVQSSFEKENFSEATFLEVDNTLTALQKLAQAHRKKFHYPVVAIAGSNGKTVVKEWLFQFLQPYKNVVRSPRSYNSKIGVPLSLWQMGKQHDVALIEAGISKQDEMLPLRDMIEPTLGIFTNIGQAHALGFPNIKAKVYEKVQLFTHCQQVIYCADYELINDAVLETIDKDKTIAWTRTNRKGALQVAVEKNHVLLKLPEGDALLPCIFKDAGSVENLIHAFLGARALGVPTAQLVSQAKHLHAVEMRLEERKGVHNNLLINDFYNADPESVKLALDLLMQQPKNRQKIVVLSAFDEMPDPIKTEAYKSTVQILNGMDVSFVMGVGLELSKPFAHLNHPHKLVGSTQKLLDELPNLKWQNAAILLKGARKYGFEKIANALQEQVHQTWLEVNLSAIAHNLRFYRQKIKPTTKLMAMVKALSYGAGSTEIARLLQYNNVDYLAVAYVDEGIALRQAGVELPIMVINPDKNALDRLIKYQLEPELFSLKSIHEFLHVVDTNFAGVKSINVHLKIETGMHRLGLNEEDLEEAILRIRQTKTCQVASIFSHLAASDNLEHEEFTMSQINRFKNASNKAIEWLGYKPLLHIANSSGIANYPQAQFDMVRLGIGLYGVANSVKEQKHLEPVTRWMTRISQIKKVASGESVGYNRSFIALQQTTIATLPVGYADGYSRALGNGKGCVFLANKKVPVIGNVCMDMIMIDVGNLPVKEGDEVELLGANITASELAKNAGTIAYEVLTNVSTRVPRVYITE